MTSIRRCPLSSRATKDCGHGNSPELRSPRLPATLAVEPLNAHGVPGSDPVIQRLAHQANVARDGQYALATLNPFDGLDFE